MTKELTIVTAGSGQVWLAENITEEAVEILKKKGFIVSKREIFPTINKAFAKDMVFISGGIK